jgi:hypothetical protein
MENLDPGTLITAGICGSVLIQLVMWIVVMIRHPGFDDLRLDLVKATPTQTSESKSGTANALSPDVLRPPVP